MRDIRIAAAQFEHRDGDKLYNLGRIRELTRRAVAQGAEIVCFHECSITAYTFLQTLNRDELEALAEEVPDGPSVAALNDIARETGAVVMAGLIEREPDGGWRVRGHHIEKIVIMTRWEYYDAVLRFQRILEALGITQALRERGVQEGDTVRIGEIELEWSD